MAGGVEVWDCGQNTRMGLQRVKEAEILVEVFEDLCAMSIAITHCAPLAKRSLEHERDD